MRFDDKQFLAEQIKLHRKKANLTQEELAERVDLSTQHISRIETGCYIPSLKSFFLIAQELNIDLKEFGISYRNKTSSVRDEFLKFIYKTSDKELEFYLNCLKTMDNNLPLIKI